MRLAGWSQHVCWRHTMKIKGGRKQGEGVTEQLGTEKHLTVVIGQGHMISYAAYH